MKNTLQQRLAGSFRQHSRLTAIECADRRISYAALGEASGRIASFFLRREIPAATRVGVLLNGRLDFICAITGLLRGRYVFVPLDPRLPVERLAAMTRHLDLAHVLTSRESLAEIGGQTALPASVNLHYLDEMDLDETGPDEIGEEPQPAGRVLTLPDCHPDDPIYVYFTSGSTGEPKGIVGRNASLLHFLEWEISTFGVGPGCKVSQFTTPGFDAALRDIFVPLLAGGMVCIYREKEQEVYEQELTQWIDDHRINLIHCVPSFFRLINHPGIGAQNYPHLQYVLLAGEQLVPRHLAQWYATMGDRIQLVNLYGATETTLVKTFYRVGPPDARLNTIPVGKPIHDTEIFVLDPQLRPCPPGVAGDVYIHTPYVSLGYFGDEALTRRKFLPDPFGGAAEAPFYDTGDVGQLLPDGNLVLLGRKDRQVKLRGVRVELPEIENALLQHANVTQAVVVARADKAGEKYLCAYYTAGAAQDAGALRTRLATHLPAYMLPNYFVFLEKLPLTPNGKVSFSDLPDPVLASQEPLTGGSRAEMEMLALWNELFEGRDVSIGLNTNFFQLGGHSIMVLQLLSKILEGTGCRMPLEAFLKTPTVQGCVAYLGRREAAEVVPVPPAPGREHYPLTPGQLKIYRAVRAGNNDYNMPSVVVLDGPLTAEQVQQLFARLVARHEVFRTSFQLVDGEPRQVVHPQADFRISFFRLDAGQAEQADEAVQACIQPFDLAVAPLLKVSLIQTGPEAHILVMDLHHIITDAVSGGIIEREIFSVYNGLELPPLQVQYKDYADWLDQEPRRRERRRQEAYWLQRFAVLPSPLQLPADHQRPPAKSFEGGIVDFECDESFTQKLNDFARREEVTLFTFLLAGYYVLLHKLGKADDIVIGIPSSGRRHPDTAQMLGLFVGGLALRTPVRGGDTFRAFFSEMKTAVSDAFEHQDYPYQDLEEVLNLPVEGGRNMLFDTWFAYQKTEKSEVKLTGSLKFKKRVNPNTVALFDLLLRAYEMDGRILFRFEYWEKLFDHPTVERFGECYRHVLLQLIERPHLPIEQVELGVPVAEKLPG